MNVALEDSARASFLAWILCRALLSRLPASSVAGTYEIHPSAALPDGVLNPGPWDVGE